MSDRRLDRREMLTRGAAAVGTVAAVGLATSAPAAASESDNPVLVGTWVGTVMRPPPAPTFDRIFTFAPGGVFVTVADLSVPGTVPTPGLGSWKTTGDNRFAFTFQVFLSDPTGVNKGFFITQAKGTISGDSIQGTFEQDIYDASGKTHRSGTFHANRFEV